MKTSRIYFMLLWGLGVCSLIQAGPYAPPAGQTGSTAIYKDDAGFVGWATGVAVQRGYIRIDNPGLGYASYGSESNALGKATGDAQLGVVSLGDGGSATLTFSHPIADGPGYDFAVFENSFSDTFLELAFVEVSSDGTNFFRFPAVSLTQTATQIGGFGILDTTNLNNFAGKYRAGYGTPFDLAELRGVSPLLDINRVTHVRIIDVVGCIQTAYARYDSLGHIINDPWATDFPTGGFDLDAVGVIHQKTVAADFNGDGVAGLADFVVLAKAWLSEPGDANWNRTCDISDPNDNVIDIIDLDAFSSQWLSID